MKPEISFTEYQRISGGMALRYPSATKGKVPVVTTG
jgi:hypothetical protein